MAQAATVGREGLGRIFSEFLAFTKEKPGHFFFFLVVMAFFAMGDGIEVIPAFDFIHQSQPFKYFHESHDILALGFALFVAYRYNVGAGAGAIVAFFFMHSPYFYLTFPAEAPEHAKILVATLGALFGCALIDLLSQALKLAGFKQEEAERARALQSKSEGELRGLLSSMSEVILIIDGWGHCHEMAVTRPKLPVRQHALRWVDKRLIDVLPEHVANYCLARIHHALDTGQTTKAQYTAVIEGRETFFEVAISPIGAERIIWVARDTHSEDRVGVAGDLRPVGEELSEPNPS